MTLVALLGRLVGVLEKTEAVSTSSWERVVAGLGTIVVLVED
jgi:hypothetical protein